jgi:hypothetical protein
VERVLAGILLIVLFIVVSVVRNSCDSSIVVLNESKCNV